MGSSRYTFFGSITPSTDFGGDTFSWFFHDGTHGGVSHDSFGGTVIDIDGGGSFDLGGFLNSVNSRAFFIEVVKRLDLNGVSKFNSGDHISNNLVVRDIVSISSGGGGGGFEESSSVGGSVSLGNNIRGRNSSGYILNFVLSTGDRSEGESSVGSGFTGGISDSGFFGSFGLRFSIFFRGLFISFIFFHCSSFGFRCDLSVVVSHVVTGKSKFVFRDISSSVVTFS